jgi:putative oxygen-independent coproporphyrinogen III oxidase
MTPSATPYGVYIQVPFCQTKCTYCNFHTGAFPKDLYAPYTTAVIREMESFSAAAGQQALRVDTAYIGGGTPSLLAPGDLAKLLDAVRGNFACEFREVTLEADPETIAAEKAAAWRAAGIDRISLGAQSFHDGELRAAGRMHRREDIFRAAEILRSTGFGNLSFDLIAGLPHQTPTSWSESLECVLRLRPEHVSIYMLEIDEESRLGRESLAGGCRYSAREIPTDDAIADFYERACELLARAGFDHYEISNWAARPSAQSAVPSALRSQHNLKYWRRERYLGFGAGAHSFDGEYRWANCHDPSGYVAKVSAGETPVETREAVTAQQALEEELFLGLRQLDGVDLEGIEQRYAVRLKARLRPLEEAGLVEMRGRVARLAATKLTISNEVFTALLGTGE